MFHFQMPSREVGRRKGDSQVFNINSQLMINLDCSDCNKDVVVVGNVHEK